VWTRKDVQRDVELTRSQLGQQLMIGPRSSVPVGQDDTIYPRSAPDEILRVLSHQESDPRFRPLLPDELHDRQGQDHIADAVSAEQENSTDVQSNILDISKKIPRNAEKE
jgi:hypothetical protein